MKEFNEIVEYITKQKRCQTSGSFIMKLIGKYHNHFFSTFESEDDKREQSNIKLLAIMKDISIKHYSYKMINGISFILLILSLIFGLFWPLIIVKFIPNLEAYIASLVQTAILSFSGLCYSLYNRYKHRQTSMENLMRELVIMDESMNLKIDRFLKTLSSTDKGASFQMDMNNPILNFEKSETDH